MQREIREYLITLSEKDYQKFSSGLIPGVDNMLGIRLPQLRKVAKEIAKRDWETAMEEPDYYFEERMLRGMVLSYASKDMDKMLPYIAEFIPMVDNWSVCDSVFMGMNLFQHLLKCDGRGCKISRLRTVTMENLSDAVEEKGLYLDKIFMAVNPIQTSAYYASMAVSWLVAEAFCCFPYHTYHYLQNNHLDDRTYNKAVQKIVESRIPSEEVKEHLRAQKRR